MSPPQAVVVPGWPQPRGYSNGMMGEGKVLYVAGQIGWLPDGSWPHGDLAGQFGQTLANVVAVVRAASVSRDSQRSLAMNSAVVRVCAGSARWPRKGIGARNGQSVSTMKLSPGTVSAVSCASRALLKVTTPVKETRWPSARISPACVGDLPKQ